MSDFSYVLPLRLAQIDAPRAELTEYLRQVAGWCDDVIVVDGSADEVFAENSRWWGELVRHVALAPERVTLMGKVGNVLTGVELARHDAVVIADDDVRYSRSELERVVALLERFEAVRPQNYFEPRPWHALWDTARSLLNRAFGADFPGTLGVRRSALMAAGGYDGSVLFENLELLRTIEAHGGRVVSPLDLYVRRLPPTAAHFWGQRTRQAYDDFALPARMALWLSIVPWLLRSLVLRRWLRVMLGALAGSGVAELGRARAGGRRVFPVAGSLLAPLWLLERGVCAWLALGQRLRFGGVRYGDSVIRVAANSRSVLRQRAVERLAEQAASADTSAEGSFATGVGTG